MRTDRARCIIERPWRLPHVAVMLAMVLAVASCGTDRTIVVPPVAEPTATTAQADAVYMRGGALRASDGTPRWSTELGPEPPIIAGGVAYAQIVVSLGASPYDAVTAVRLKDGATLWATGLPANLSSGPAVLTGDGLLVVATFDYTSGLTDNLRLVALRTADGSIAWQSAPRAVVRRPTVDSPVPFVSPLAFAGGHIVALADSGPNAAVATAWNATDGSQAWHIALPHASAYAGASASLVVSGGTLVAAYESGSGQVIGGLEPAHGTWTWSHTIAGAGLDLATEGALVLSDSDTLTALRPADGATRWTRRLGAGLAHGVTEMAASDTTIFYGNYLTCPGATIGPGSDLQQVACQQIYAVRLDDGKLLWQRQLSPNPIYNATNSVYGDGVLYYQFFTDMRVTLLALDDAHGGVLWTRATSGLFNTIAAGAGGVYGVSESQGGSCFVTITAFKAQDGSQRWQQPYSPCPHSIVGGFLHPFWLMVG